MESSFQHSGAGALAISAAPSLPHWARVVHGHVHRAGTAVWRGLEAHGRAKGLRELRALHDRWEASDPDLALQVRRASAYLRSPIAP